MPSLTRLLVALPLVLGACQSSTPPAQPSYPQGQYPQQPYPQGQYPQQPQGQYPQQPQQQQPAPAVQRPLLAPLVGVPAMQQEVRNVLAELIAALSAQNQALVRGIPLQFDPTVEVNAYAGCDEQGTPFLAGTAGILEAVDAIAQTKATDELFGTQTYDAYCNAVLPQIVKSSTARAALPAGIIPTNYGGDARRWSRAHEIFDEVIAFTFGHELAHHYLGHTGCAKGQSMGTGPDPLGLGRLAMRIPTFNQVGESAADSAGIVDMLDAGRARRPQYAWSENGAFFLVDYFSRIERAAGGGNIFSPTQVLRTHPNPTIRIVPIQGFARAWRAQHPG